jgi:hypothetical protein
MARSNISYSDTKILTGTLVKNKGKELYSFLKKHSYNLTPKKRSNGDLVIMSYLILNHKSNYDDELECILTGIDQLVFELNKKNTNIQNITISAAFTNDPDLINKIKSNKKEEIKTSLKSSVLVNVLEQDCTRLGNLFVANMMVRNKLSFSYPTKKYFFFKITSKTNSL